MGVVAEQLMTLKNDFSQKISYMCCRDRKNTVASLNGTRPALMCLIYRKAERSCKNHNAGRVRVVSPPDTSVHISAQAQFTNEHVIIDLADDNRRAI